MGTVLFYILNHDLTAVIGGLAIYLFFILFFILTYRQPYRVTSGRIYLVGRCGGRGEISNFILLNLRSTKDYILKQKQKQNKTKKKHKKTTPKILLLQNRLLTLTTDPPRKETAAATLYFLQSLLS